MTEKVIIAGEGGQGIMLLGKILAQVALREDKNTTWLPSYGAEVRGGAAFCMVIISDDEISSPYIDFADTIIAMNEQSLKRFKDRIKPNGLLLVNSSLIDPNTLTWIFANLTQMIADKKSACIRVPCQSSTFRRDPAIGSDNWAGQSAEICVFPFTEIASKLGDVKYANMVALGCYLKKKRIISLKNMSFVLKDNFSKGEIFRLNEKAIREGLKLIK